MSSYMETIDLVRAHRRLEKHLRWQGGRSNAVSNCIDEIDKELTRRARFALGVIFADDKVVLAVYLERATL